MRKDGEDEERQKTEKDIVLNQRLFRKSYTMEKEDDTDIKMKL